MEAASLQEGVELMIAGMGTVFVFLTCLVFATSAMSVLIQRFNLESEPGKSAITDEEVAAISAAIRQHRREH